MTKPAPIALIGFDPGRQAGLAVVAQRRKDFAFVRSYQIAVHSYADLWSELAPLVVAEARRLRTHRIVAVVEMPPERVRGKAPQAGPIGFAAGIFGAVCYALEWPVVRAPVSVIRRVVFGRSDLGRLAAKRAAHRVSLREYGVDPATDDECDAVMVCRWAQAVIQAPSGHRATKTTPGRSLIQCLS